MALCHKAFVTKYEFKKLRESAGHTQASLAVAMGVHLRTVWRWELGETVIPRVVELALRYVAQHAGKARDAVDLKQARASLSEAKRKGTVPWAKIKKDLRLKRRRKKH
jgi:transcriptional regulator with XRE-family HTH domain